MDKNRINFIGNFFPGIGLGLTLSYEKRCVYIMGAILCFQFYLDINLK